MNYANDLHRAGELGIIEKMEAAAKNRIEKLKLDAGTVFLTNGYEDRADMVQIVANNQESQTYAGYVLYDMDSKKPVFIPSWQGLTRQQYSLSHVITGQHSDPLENWVHTPIEIRAYALNKFKAFLLKGTRSGSKNQRALHRMDLYNLPKDYGIFRRLYINRHGEAEYIAGQDYTAEIRLLRELITKHC